MREIAIYNPAAGKGKTKKITDTGYCTQYQGDCKRFVKEECLKDPDVHFIVYGGDGTLNEAISGIMEAGTGHISKITVMPYGSGNDTIKTIETLSDNNKVKEMNLDVIKYNDKFSINMLNIGFDCNVVSSASKFKKKLKIAGKLSYLLGVATEFFKPFGENFTIEATCENDEKFTYNGSCLLCAVCNGEWCGGSFHNSPPSDMTDGIMEMILVKKIGRLSFIKLISKYKNGTLIDPKTFRATADKYVDKVVYLRLKELKISGMKQLCADGEVENCQKATISVLPGAIQYKI